jgi:coatomer protein complex subunit epsilon
MADGPDHLFPVRNNFFLGNYQAAVNAVMSGVTVDNDSQAIERDVLLYRSYIALGNYGLVLAEIADDAPTALQAVKLLATYKSNPDGKEMVLLTLKEWTNDPNTMNNPTLLLIAGMIFTCEGKLEDAIRNTHSGTTLEMLAMNVDIYIKMNRMDLAERESKLMQQMDDDATLTQLASAWVSLAIGGKRMEEANSIFQDMSEKYDTGKTPMILNGMAVALMAMGQYDEAERVLLESLGKSSNDVQTLENLIVCTSHLRKPVEVINRYVSQLKMASPNCELIAERTMWESTFDRVAASYQPEVSG